MLFIYTTLIALSYNNSISMRILPLILPHSYRTFDFFFRFRKFPPCSDGDGRYRNIHSPTKLHQEVFGILKHDR